MLAPRPSRFTTMKQTVAILEQRYSSTRLSTSALNMAVSVTAKPLPLYHYQSDSSHCTVEVYLYSSFIFGTKDGISWIAPRPVRFNPMKFKVLIVQQMYTSALSST
jgi:hypothetical protein